MHLHHQHSEQTGKCEADKLIRQDALNEVEQRFLKEVFRQGRNLLRRLKLDYQL